MAQERLTLMPYHAETCKIRNKDKMHSSTSCHHHRSHLAYGFSILRTDCTLYLSTAKDQFEYSSRHVRMLRVTYG